MDITLSPQVKREVSSTIEDYGYRSEREFIEDALRHRILELKKADFLVKIKKIRDKMKEKNLAEKEILEDFSKFSHA